MKEQLELLHQLQTLDTTIDACNESLADLDDGTALRQELEQAKEKSDELQEELHQLQSTLRDRELELQGTENEREEKWNLAYGGTISDSKELANLEKKINELKRNQERLENELLEGYEQADALESELEEQKNKITSLSEELEETVENYEQTSANLNNRIERAEEERQDIVEQLDEKLVTEYERLREKMGGLAVAEMKDGVCTGCNITVSTFIVRKLRDARDLVKCENCLRILYYDG
ncbi:MAG: C4-type zinc ribbon domain-containing protein [Armatimonadota bacterium]